MKKIDLFKLHDTHGIPIQFIAEELDHCNLSFNWLIWMKSAIDAGWTYEKIKSTICDVNNQIYDRSWKQYEYLIPTMYLILTGNYELD